MPASLAERAAQIQEREQQIQGFNAAMRAQAERIEAEAWQVARIITNDPKLSQFHRADLLTIKQFIGKLGYWPVMEAAEITSCKFSYFGRRTFSYFCGICWKKVRGGSNGAGA